MARYRAIPSVQVADLRQAPDPEPEPDEGYNTELTGISVEVSYRDLQARAKDLDIPANQSREDLEAAIAEADR